MSQSGKTYIGNIVKNHPNEGQILAGDLIKSKVIFALK